MLLSAESWGDLGLVLVALAVCLLTYALWSMSMFTRRGGIQTLPGNLPLVGHMGNTLLRREHFKDVVTRVYNYQPNDKYIGFYQINLPIVVIRDLELIKQLAVKEYDKFLDHIGFISEEGDPLFGNNLFTLKGQKWRDMRAALSPAFTSSKMRNMFSLIADCGEEMTKYFLKEGQTQADGVLEVEMKDCFTRYTNDVIASSAFGIKVNSLAEKDNEFYKMGKKASNFTGIAFLKFFAYGSFPRLSKFFKVSLFDSDVKHFFRSIVADTMKSREEQSIHRPDMIQLLMEAKKGSLKHETTAPAEGTDAGFATVQESSIGKLTVKREWTDDELTAQALLFFIAGFDTSSALLCFMAHELTIHQEVQRKLQREIDAVWKSCGGKITYSEIHSLKYMDMVVSETLRIWPPAVATDRCCIKTYTLPPANDSATKGYTIQPGEGIWIPIYGIHHNPEYFPNPEMFDPERFSDENKKNIVPNSFLPFGVGPRNCIGSRFALMEAKSVMFHMLAKFDFVVTSNTQNPIQLRNDSFNLHSERGFWIGLKKRNLT